MSVDIYNKCTSTAVYCMCNGDFSYYEGLLLINKLYV